METVNNMRPTSLNLTASSPEDAINQAISRFETQSDSIAVTALDDGSYRAELLDHDADLRVEISQDKMTAVVVDFLPARGKGRPMSQDDLLLRLMERGVGIPPSTATIALLLERVRLKENVIGAVIVRGIEPRPPTNAFIEPIGDWNFPVFPGDVIGRYVPPEPAREGRLVTGEKKTVRENDSPLHMIFAGNAGCRPDQETSLVVAEQYGLVVVEGLNVRVDPLIYITDRKMTVKAMVYARTSSGEPTTPDHFKKALDWMKIKAPLQEQSLLDALKQARQQKNPLKDVTLARGILPISGRNGLFNPMITSTPDTCHGRETANGRVDYRARHMVRSVQPGDLLGHLMPPEPGTLGRDVLGAPIPARNGRPFKLKIAENVRASEDGRDFFATTEGMVFFVGDTLKVTEIFHIQGDVNLSVGNVKLERGSAHIGGSVLDGFRVEAPGNVVIRNVVENSVIIAGGDVQVNCGIIGGQVEASGSVFAMYANNAVIRADADVNIAQEAANCTIYAGRRVVANRGRGKISGGVISCNEGVLAKEIGSSIGIETFIFLGVDIKTEEDLAAKKKQLEERLRKVYTALGSGDAQSILNKAPPEKHQAVAQVLKARMQYEQELQDIENQIKQAHENHSPKINLRVKATVGIHPDVIIKCFQSHFRTTTFLQNPTIIYDAEKKKLIPE